MRNLWYEACYAEALTETDQNLKLARIDEAIAAIALRLQSPQDAESEEDVNLTPFSRRALALAAPAYRF